MSRGDVGAIAFALTVLLGVDGGCAQPHDDDDPADDDSADDDTADDDSADDDTADDDTVGDDDDTSPPPYNGCGQNRDGQRAAGSWIEPIEAPYLPFFDRNDTSVGPEDAIDSYDCALDVGESGPEIVYRFVTETDGDLRAEVACDDPVDVDLHLLADPQVNDGVASGCIARAHIALEVDDLPAGEYWLVADSWSDDDGNEYDGAYELAFEWISEEVWTDVTLAPGVTWSRLRDPDLQGGDQTVNMLAVEPLGGVDLQPALHGGCRSVPDVATDLGAYAGINAGFFSGGCGALDMLKADGELLATNAVTGSAQRSLGWTPGTPPVFDWIDAGADWPEVSDAVGAHPSLVTAGQRAVEPSSGDSFYTSRHPRSAMALTGDGTLLLMTVDGRTAAGDGMTTDQLADLLLDLGAVDAANLDGGGSTTLVVEDCWIGDVVNSPSDNGAADHHGERSVADGLYLR